MQPLGVKGSVRVVVKSAETDKVQTIDNAHCIPAPNSSVVTLTYKLQLLLNSCVMSFSTSLTNVALHIKYFNFTVVKLLF